MMNRLPTLLRLVLLTPTPYGHPITLAVAVGQGLLVPTLRLGEPATGHARAIAAFVLLGMVIAPALEAWSPRPKEVLPTLPVTLRERTLARALGAAAASGVGVALCGVLEIVVSRVNAAVWAPATARYGIAAPDIARPLTPLALVLAWALLVALPMIAEARWRPGLRIGVLLAGAALGLIGNATGALDHPLGAIALVAPLALVGGVATLWPSTGPREVPRVRMHVPLETRAPLPPRDRLWRDALARVARLSIGALALGAGGSAALTLTGFALGPTTTPAIGAFAALLVAQYHPLLDGTASLLPLDRGSIARSHAWQSIAVVAVVAASTCAVLIAIGHPTRALSTLVALTVALPGTVGTAAALGQVHRDRSWWRDPRRGAAVLLAGLAQTQAISALANPVWTDTTTPMSPTAAQALAGFADGLYGAMMLGALVASVAAFRIAPHGLLGAPGGPGSRPAGAYRLS